MGIESVLQICHDSNVTVFFEPTDPLKARKVLQSPWAARAIKYTSPNMHELQMMANDASLQQSSSSCCNLDALIRECTDLGRSLMRQMPYTTLIITLGKHGVLLMDADDKTCRHYAADKVQQVKSVSGAGDCLTAGFIAGLLNGLGHSQALAMGLKAAQLSLQSFDTVPDTLDLTSVSPDES